jgi:hypothetical protein
VGRYVQVSTTEKKQVGFVKGESGNPGGRPKGSKNQITLLRQSLELQLREAAAPDIVNVMKKAVELALDGDRTMIKLLLELHMAKQVNDNEHAAEKVSIQITSTGPQTVAPVKHRDIIDAEILTK